MEFSEPSRKRRRGGKIYQGCSTCQLRKIKCLGGYPICLNCKRSRRYICSGNTGELQADNNDQRRRIDSDVVDRAEAAEVAIQPPVDGGNIHSDLLELTFSEEIAQLFPHSLDRNQDACDRSLPWQTDVGTLDLDLAALQTTADIFTSSGLDLTFLSASCTGTPQPSPNPQTSIILSSIPAAPHARSMEALLEHWRTYICPIMIPTAAPDKNPYLHIYLPMALSEPQTDSKRCLLLTMLSVAAHSRAELSINDKADLRRQATELKQEAASSLKHLLDSLESAMIDDVDKETLMTAALTMTTIEVFSGEDKGTAYENLLLAKQLLQLTGGVQWWLQTTARSTLLQIFRCHEILAHTSGWRPFKLQPTTPETVEVSTAGVSFNDSPENGGPEQGSNATSLTLDDNYTLDISFGVSKFSLRCLNKILELAAIKTAMTEGQTWTPSQVDQLDKLEGDVFEALQDHNLLSFPNQSEIPYQEGISNYISEELTQNHVLAFHNAVAIFFRRALCDGSATVTLPLLSPESPFLPSDPIPQHRQHRHHHPTSQELISTALSHIENIDAIAGDAIIANTLWPAFIVAVEAVDTPLRQRALIWFARARRHGIGNIAKAKQLVMEVWRRVDRLGRPRTASGELGGVDWRNVMEEMGMYIMLT